MEVFRCPKAEGKDSMGWSLIYPVLKATPEMTWQMPKAEAACLLMDDIESHDRIEFYVHDKGQCVAFAALMADEDPNVGPCASIHSFFIRPEYRGALGQRMFREILRTARDEGHKVLGFTQRTGLGRYSLKYIQL